MRTPHVASGSRYPVLRAFAILYLIGAVVALISGIVGAGWALIAAPWNVGNRVVLALLTLAGAFFLIVGSLAVAEIIKLFIDIEHNTRAMAMRDTMVEAPAARAPSMVSPSTDGGWANRIRELDEETAEGALLRGH
jgi:hypothetical protein